MKNFIEVLERVITAEDKGIILFEFAGRLIEVKPIAITQDVVDVEIKKDQLDGTQADLAGVYTVPITRLIVKNHRTSRP